MKVKNLTHSKDNVRKSNRNFQIPELADNILEVGLLQNLVVKPLKKAGHFSVKAGDRRLSALQYNIERGSLPADHEVMVMVLSAEASAHDASFSENYQRVPMNPADECTAFNYYITKEGMSVEDVAKRQGVTTRFVEQRIDEAIIFQGIVRRSTDLDHVTIISAWTCSKMRPDGFGGGITVVTADDILSSSTNQMESELLDRAEYGELGCAPGHGSHVLLRLDEKKVRESIDAIVAAGLPSAPQAAGVTDHDIRAACGKAVAAADLVVQHEALIAIVARGAIAIAQERTA